jgi:hypothetical protein
VESAQNLWHFLERAWQFPQKGSWLDPASSVDIDRKLCLTAAVLGVASRKELAAAFRSANPATAFDLERAHKWLQGRARPRDASLYEDWNTVLDIGRPGAWIAGCTLEDFIVALCMRGPLAREALQQRAEAFRGGAGPNPGRPLELAGRYACYSNAWSPYFRGRLIRGDLAIGAGGGTRRVVACYTEHLPTGPLRVEGPVTMAERAMHFDLRASGGAHLMFCLFPPTAPSSLLAGLMCGATVIGPDAQPSVTRIAMVRLPESILDASCVDAYLQDGGSIVADLARRGMNLSDPEPLETGLAAFLRGGTGGGFDQIQVGSFKLLVEQFDRQWFGRRG